MHFFKKQSLYRVNPLRFLLFASVLLVAMGYKCSPAGNKRKTTRVRVPSVRLESSASEILLPCPPDTWSSGSCPREATNSVTLTTVPTGFDEVIVYTYSVTGGRIVGAGKQVMWELGGLGPGSYTATVETDDFKHKGRASTSVTVRACPDCRPSLSCSTIIVDCPNEVADGRPAVCSVELRPAVELATYKWTLTDQTGANLTGRISGDATRPGISIRTDRLKGKKITATVTIGGLGGCYDEGSKNITIR